MYGEAQSSESRKDFIHKMKLSLKELRETFVCLKLIDKRSFVKDSDLLKKALIESNELISIFVKSIETATKNLKLNSWFGIRYSLFIIQNGLYENSRRHRQSDSAGLEE